MDTREQIVAEFKAEYGRPPTVVANHWTSHGVPPQSRGSARAVCTPFPAAKGALLNSSSRLVFAQFS